MRGLNRATILGFCGKDPEIKYAASGVAIANLSIATEESKKNASGEYESFTEWHKVVAFGKTAEVIKDYVKKGSKLYIEGRIQTRSWEQNNETKYMTEIVCNQMIMLDSQNKSSQPSQQQAPPVNSSTDDDQGLPF